MTDKQFTFYIKVISATLFIGALAMAWYLRPEVKTINPLMPVEGEIQYQESFMPEPSQDIQYVELYADDLKFGEIFWIMRDWNREFFYWRGKKYHTMTMEEVEADAIPQ